MNGHTDVPQTIPEAVPQSVPQSVPSGLQRWSARNRQVIPCDNTTIRSRLDAVTHRSQYDVTKDLNGLDPHNNNHLVLSSPSEQHLQYKEQPCHSCEAHAAAAPSPKLAPPATGGSSEDLLARHPAKGVGCLLGPRPRTAIPVPRLQHNEHTSVKEAFTMGLTQFWKDSQMPFFLQ